MKTKDTAMNAMRFTVSLAALCVIAGGSAQAQLDSATTIANPSRVEGQFLEDTNIPDIGENIEIESPILQQVPPNADQIKFTLNTLSLDGVSAYKADDVAYLYEDMLGSVVTLSDIYAISSALTTKYRNEGYVLTQVIVPPQTIDGGNVRLQVIEGVVDRIIVQGEEEEHTLALIRSYAAQVGDVNALNVKDLERSLLLINDLPGVSARSILSPSRSRSGASDLRILVERDYYEALLGVDNFGSRYLGPVQFTAAAAANSVFGHNEQISGQFVIAPDLNEVELAYGAVSYEQPINAYGTRARAFLSHSDTTPGFDLETFDVRGRSTQMGVGVTHPVIRSRTQNLTARAQFDWRKVESSNDLEATREDNIRALRYGGRYEFLDTLLSVGVNSLDVEVSHGLSVLGASDDNDANLTRPDADPDSFMKAVVEAQRLQRITQDVNLLLAARGQMSNRALLSSEEFGVGGVNYGRGYDASELVGEDGIATKVELQWDNPVAWSAPENYEVYSFYDFGKVWNDDSTTADDDDSLASAGFGVRGEFINNFQAGAAVAFPLTRDVEITDDRGPRFYFNLNRTF